MSGNGVNLAGCATCAGECCRKYRVPVTAHDVRKLAAGTGLRPSDFAWLVPATGEGFRLRRDGQAMEVHLQRRPDGGACVLLMEIAPGKARCGVYAHRPLVCSNFPLTLKHGVVAAREDALCGPGAWNLTALDLPACRRDIIADNDARIEHRQIMLAWNASVDASGREATADELFDFLLNHQVEPAETS
jgi:Fe-S-cluster containining protein